jgi:hypothetical protein
MTKKKSSPSTTPESPVEAFLRASTHPLTPEIERVRGVILGVSPTISEAIKWNAPSFKTTDFFATFHLRSTSSVQLVFHMGAKAKATAQTGLEIEDPTKLCKWLAKDRCLVELGTGEALVSRLPAFAELVRQWLRWL